MTPEILAALGLPETATPEEILACVNDLVTAAAEAKDAKSEDETADETGTEEVPATPPETTQVADACADAGTADEAPALKDKLKTAANDAVQAAVAAGRLTPAEADGKVSEILAANDLAAALQSLRKLPAKVKTTSATGDLGTAKARLVIAANDESKAARDARQVAVANEYSATNPALPPGERKRIAWERAQRKNPDLFGKSAES